MTKTIVLIHGAWMTPLCWEKFQGFYEGKGYTCIAPSWPHKDRPIEEQQSNPDPALAKLGVTEIVDHYDKIIRGLNEKPILIGHSFGGLFVQMLLDRGLGAAGVAIDSAPPKGVFAYYPTVFRSLMGVLLTPFGWNKIVRTSLNAFSYAFVHSLPEAERRAVYERYVVPETGRIFFQGATSMFHNVTRVNFQNNSRAPLLLIAGAEDHVCPAAQNRGNYNQYKNSSAKTDFKVFDQRVHWIIGQSGWEEVAAYVLDWAEGVVK
jgi:pimeloyl-ACP methyl ester carboxylesterase